MRYNLCLFNSLLVGFGIISNASCSLVDPPQPDACANVSCSNHGNCVIFQDQPTCACDDGFVADSVNGLSCVSTGSSGKDAGRSRDTGTGVDAARTQDSGPAGSDAGGPGFDGGPEGDAGGLGDAGVAGDTGVIRPAEACESAHCRGDYETEEGNGVVCVDEHFAFIPSGGATPNLDRYSRTEPIPGEAVVSDTLSQLMWTGCPLGLSGNNCQNGSRQSLMPTEQTTACSNLNWAGFNDWVRPEGILLQSILDRRKEQPTLDETMFPWITDDGRGSIYLGPVLNLGAGPQINLEAGTVSHTSGPATASLCVRALNNQAVNHLVRRCFETTYGVAATPTTTDPSTGLQWQSCSAGLAGANCDSGTVSSLTWDAAKQYCDTLDWAGEQDWRLPSVDQMLSIASSALLDSNNLMTTPSGLFQNADSNYFWTSTPRPFFGNMNYFRWRADRGYTYSSYPDTVASIRCVRGDRWANEITYPSEVCREMTPVGHAGLRSGDDMQLVRSESESAGEHLVTDSYYGLQWTGCLLGLSGSQCEHGAVQAVTPANLEAACSSLQWGARDDWRVASLNEVRSLFDYRVNTERPMSTPVLTAFPGMDGLSQAAGISGDGRYSESTKAAYIAYNGSLVSPNRAGRGVLCVRDHGEARPRRVNRCLQTTAWSRAEGTVIDTDSGLEWMACYAGLNGAGCSNGVRTLARINEVNEACEDLTWAGHSNWRLPSANDVLTVFDANRFYRTKVDHRAFPYWGDTAGVLSYWTTSLGPSSHQVRQGNFTSNLYNSNSNTTLGYRCVRSLDGN
jgi:hypothetical protein